MVNIPTHRQPTHPGEMLLKEFLEPMGISEQELAEKIHLSDQLIHQLVNEQINISASIALRLGKFFGMSPEFWLNLQLRWDLYYAQKVEADILNQIHPIVI
jgi:addiction module HigA family antidote